MGYPIIDRGLRRLVRDELGDNPLCHEVARKAQARGAVSMDISEADRHDRGARRRACREGRARGRLHRELLAGLRSPTTPEKRG